MQNVQNEFDKQNRNNDLAPFREVTNEEVDLIIDSYKGKLIKGRFQIEKFIGKGTCGQVYLVNDIKKKNRSDKHKT